MVKFRVLTSDLRMHINPRRLYQNVRKNATVLASAAQVRTQHLWHCLVVYDKAKYYGPYQVSKCMVMESLMMDGATSRGWHLKVMSRCTSNRKNETVFEAVASQQRSTHKVQISATLTENPVFLIMVMVMQTVFNCVG